MAGKELTTDSSLRFAEMRKGHQLRSQLSQVANSLKLHDKLSAVFLLCNTPKTGLELMEEILNESNPLRQNTLFYNWLKQVFVFTDKNWQDKLAELLTILQNFKLAKITNQTKQKLIEEFKPKNNLKTCWISGIRKVLYNLCEELNSSQCTDLITAVENDFHNAKYLEHKILKWSERGIISLGGDKPIDLNIIVKWLKSFGLNNIASDIEILTEKTNCLMMRSTSSELKLQSETSEYYEIISENYLGLCVIINEKNFTSSLFPKRQGSDKDAERLIEVFTAFGFDIKLHTDLTFKQLIHTLALYAKTVDKSSSFFILIILSHGSENVIYTSDSHPVDMNTIEMIFQAELCPNLLGKPKIFIVQSCQGEKGQRVMWEESPSVQTDSAVIPDHKLPPSVGPQRGDSMIAWSTVQGFASFRDRHNGSWYIEELCNQLWKFGDAIDLVEILTKVNNSLRSKVFGGQFMVPSLLLSLRAKVQFPRKRETFVVGRKLMLERLIFDKYFREFLITSKSPELELLFGR